MRTVRVRTAAVASLVVALAFLAVSFFLVQQLRASLIAEVDRSNDARAADLATANELELNELTLSLDEDTVAALLVAVDEFDDSIKEVQISTDANLTAQQVTEAFPELNVPQSVSYPNLVDTVGSDNLRGVTQDLLLLDEEDGSLFSVGDLVFVASSLDPVDRSVSNLIRNLAVVGPLLVLVVAALVWWLTGRALRPVENIRAEAESIGASALHRRVPETGVDDEVGRLATTVNSMLERIEVSQRTQRQFVADASHELRSPLASIAAQLEVDRTHPETADHQATADMVGNQTARMQTMVEDLLLLARADDGSLAAPVGLVDLDDAVVEARQAVAVPPEVRVDLSKVSAGSIRGNPEQIHRLVTNLLANAVRHATSLVAVGVSEHADSVVLVVDDDGTGIDPSDRTAIFERFVRLDEARTRDRGGSGLGLAISAEIAAAHQATIEVGDSALGGAHFSVTFPRA